MDKWDSFLVTPKISEAMGKEVRRRAIEENLTKGGYDPFRRYPEFGHPYEEKVRAGELLKQIFSEVNQSGSKPSWLRSYLGGGNDHDAFNAYYDHDFQRFKK